MFQLQTIHFMESMLVRNIPIRDVFTPLAQVVPEPVGKRRHLREPRAQEIRFNSNEPRMAQGSDSNRLAAADAARPKETLLMNLHRPGSWLLIAALMLSLCAASLAQVAVGISVRIGPPALPVYAQPICPGPGYIWTPGYWAWNDDAGYYWVPGTWVVAPVGMLWTPGYWGWGGGVYAWHAGYWGPHIGFYGGINYGFGYGGVGFAGGEWRGGAFSYNRSVTNVSVTSVTHVYTKTVVVNENHVAFNGGQGGVQAHATAREEAYAREKHTAPLAAQTQHEHAASQNRQNFASENHGKPAIAATAKPGDFSAHSAVAARSAGGEYHAPKISPKEARATPNNAANKSTMAGSKASKSGNKGGSNEGFHSFNQPKNSTTASNSHNNNMTHNNQSHANLSRPQPQTHNSQPKEGPRPQVQRRPSPPPPAPHRSSPPPPPQHHGKGR